MARNCPGSAVESATGVWSLCRGLSCVARFYYAAMTDRGPEGTGAENARPVADERITYRARAIRWEEGWELDVEGVGVTHLDALEDAESAVSDYIKTAMGVDTTGAEIVIEEVDPHIQDLTGSADKADRPAP